MCKIHVLKPTQETSPAASTQPDPRQHLMERVSRDELANQLSGYERRRFPRWRRPERVSQEGVYRNRVREWLSLPENRWCRVYLLLGRQVRATECHHYQGRRGMLLLYEPFWIAVSREGHRWIDEHRQQARALGLLCPLGRFNSPVRGVSEHAKLEPGIPKALATPLDCNAPSIP